MWIQIVYDWPKGDSCLGKHLWSQTYGAAVERQASSRPCFARIFVMQILLTWSNVGIHNFVVMLWEAGHWFLVSFTTCCQIKGILPRRCWISFKYTYSGMEFICVYAFATPCCENLEKKTTPIGNQIFRESPMRLFVRQKKSQKSKTSRQ